MNFQYDYSLDGNQLSEKKQPLVDKESRYSYDDLGRLQAESEIISNTINQSYQYTYDDYNNRKSLVVSGQKSYSKEYEYDLNNRLNKDIENIAGILANTNIYDYDANGNTITNTTKKTPNEPDVIQTRTYNLYNQVKATNTSEDMINYTYSINGMRNSKTINGIRTDFINSGGHVVAENTNGQYITYLRGINLIANSTNQDYYLYNAHGDVVALADEAGNVKKHYQYDAFGVELTPNQTDINPFRHCGEYYDQETGEIYLRARYYDPVIGRFITEDSYKGNTNDTLSLNLYTHCANNPIMYVDPTGHDYATVLRGSGPSFSFGGARSGFRVTVSNPRVATPAVQTSFISNNPTLVTPVNGVTNVYSQGIGYANTVDEMDIYYNEIQMEKAYVRSQSSRKVNNTSSGNSSMPDPGKDPNNKDSSNEDYSSWNKGSFDSSKDSLEYHYKKNMEKKCKSK